MIFASEKKMLANRVTPIIDALMNFAIKTE